MKALCELLRGAGRWFGRVIGSTSRGIGNGPVRAAAAVQGAADATREVLGRARGRHADRFRADDQYRTLLLTAVGALLSTVMPPAVAATATAVIGYSGLLDRLWAEPQARPKPSGYRPQYQADEHPTGNRLWDQFPYDD